LLTVEPITKEVKDTYSHKKQSGGSGQSVKIVTASNQVEAKVRLRNSLLQSGGKRTKRVSSLL